MRRALLLLSLLLPAALPHAQTAASPDELLRAMDDAVARSDYETAEARAREALDRFDTLAPDQIVTVHTTLGILLYARNEPIEAREHFQAALSLLPTLSLDPLLVSPKTVQFFEEVKADMAPAAASAGPAPEVRYVTIEDNRVDATVRSLLLPGWGQFHKGDRAKGWAFAIGTGTLATGALAAETRRAQARTAYLDAETQAEAERLYPAYNRWTRTRTALVYGTAVVWAVAALDALVTGAPDAGAVSMGPASGANGVQLTVRF